MGDSFSVIDQRRSTPKKLPMRIDVDVRLKSAVRERWRQSEIVSEEIVVEVVPAETVGVEDAVTAEVSIVVEETTIGEVPEDQGRPLIGAEIPEIEDHFVGHPRQETLTPTFQEVVVTAEGMNPAVDHPHVQSRRFVPHRARAHAHLHVDAARPRSLYHQNHGEEVNHLIGNAVNIAAEVVVGE